MVKLRDLNSDRSTTGWSSVSSTPPEQQRHHRDDGERDDLGRVEPVQLLALIEHDLQRTDADDQQYRADGVDRFDLGFGFSPFNVAIAATITKTPIGMLMKKIQPQW